MHCNHFLCSRWIQIFISGRCKTGPDWTRRGAMASFFLQVLKKWGLGDDVFHEFLIFPWFSIVFHSFSQCVRRCLFYSFLDFTSAANRSPSALSFLLSRCLARRHAMGEPLEVRPLVKARRYEELAPETKALKELKPSFARKARPAFYFTENGCFFTGLKSCCLFTLFWNMQCYLMLFAFFWLFMYIYRGMYYMPTDMGIQNGGPNPKVTVHRSFWVLLCGRKLMFDPYYCLFPTFLMFTLISCRWDRL